MDNRDDVEGAEARISHDGSARELPAAHRSIKDQRSPAIQPESRRRDAVDRGSLRNAIKEVLPHQRTLLVQGISFLGLAYAAFGFYNQYYLHWIPSVWFGTYADRIAIVIFGVARIFAERNPYTRRRLIFLVSAVAGLWLVLPFFFNNSFFNHHTFGTPWFFIYLVIIFLIGRRADCSWNCTCVGIRDTAGEPFR